MEKSDYFRSPKQLVEELGILGPEDIDIDAIAFHCGATTRYRPLTGCAARIVGSGHNAIITVDSNSSRPRQRFSAAHELGHWMHDRGTASFSCEEGVFAREWSRSNPESRANAYASDLLLPTAFFKPRASEFKTIDFDTVRTLADEFGTSLTATAIRLVEHGPLPTMLVCNSDSGREWFVRGSVSKSLWPLQSPSPHSYVLDLLNKGKRELCGGVSAAAWFDHPVAKDHYVEEHSVDVGHGSILSLLWWKDETMLITLDGYEEDQVARRSDRREID